MSAQILAKALFGLDNFAEVSSINVAFICSNLVKQYYEYLVFAVYVFNTQDGNSEESRRETLCNFCVESQGFKPCARACKVSRAGSNNSVITVGTRFYNPRFYNKM